MRARTRNIWMIISLLALGMMGLYGYSSKKDISSGKEVCTEQVKEKDGKKTIYSLQLWENMIRL